MSASYVDAAIATVQLHGGIGFTWEHDAHLYQKNAMSQHALFGGPGEQLDRLTALLARPARKAWPRRRCPRAAPAGTRCRASCCYQGRWLASSPA